MYTLPTKIFCFENIVDPDQLASDEAKKENTCNFFFKLLVLFVYEVELVHPYAIHVWMYVCKNRRVLILTSFISSNFSCCIIKPI